MDTISPQTIADLRRSSTPTVAGVLFKLGYRNIFMQGVRPLGEQAETMVGQAYTLRFLPAREDLENSQPRPADIHRESFEQTPPGHVLVMDCRGETHGACCGDILVTRLMVRGGAGIVTDGGVRDSTAIAKMPMPVYAAGSSPPVSRVAHSAVEHGRPIACGGVAVFPGDVIVGDGDGVVVVPLAVAAKVAAEALQKDAQDAFVAKRIAAGAPIKGNFPPDADTLQAFEAWQANNREND